MTNWTERLIEAIDRLTSHGDSPNGPGHRLILTVDVDELERLAAEARDALAQPEPEGPTDEELWQIWHDVDGSIPTIFRAVLARFGRPAIEPVPASERPWERDGWCDAEGRCWMANNELLEWAFRKQYKSLDSYYFYGYTHLLPHWALPVHTSQEPVN
jgi:hypothetical protein